MEIKAEIKISVMDKLADIVDKAIGLFYAKKDSDNKAYKVIAMTKAKAESIRLIAEALQENASAMKVQAYEDENISLEAQELKKLYIYILTVIQDSISLFCIFKMHYV